MGPLLAELTDTELHEAVRFSDIEEVKQALSNKNDPNQIGLYQWAPIHEAAENGELHILQLLLKHGGDPNVVDVLNGRTPLHYAAIQGHCDCVKLLLQHGASTVLQDSHSQTVFQVAHKSCLNILQKHKDDITKVKDTGAENIETKDHPEVDSPDIGSPASFCREESSSALGYIELSFEYDRRKGSLCIRVWQITNLLLSDSSSMINSVYVKSLLVPDKNRGTKRKTEELKVHASDHVTTQDQTLFRQVSFSFSKPLQYAGLTMDDILKKSVQIEVCLTQKYTRKSFLFATFCLPCKSAVKKLVRQSYPLKSCDNPTIPNNMKLYSVDNLQTPHLNIFHHVHSYPDVRSMSQISLNSDSSGYPASDSMLESVAIERKNNARTPNIVINIPDDPELLEVISLDSGVAESLSVKETSISMESDKSLAKPDGFKITTKKDSCGRSSNKNCFRSSPSKDNTPTWDNYDLEHCGVLSAHPRLGEQFYMSESLLPLPSSFDIPGEDSSISIAKVAESNPERAAHKLEFGDKSDKGKRLLGKKGNHGKKSGTLRTTTVESFNPTSRNTVIDIEDTEVLCEIPNHVLTDFTIPMQVFVSEDSE